MRRAAAPAAALAFAAAGLLLTGAGAEEGRAAERVRTGEAIYADKCVYCHAEGGWGTRSLAKRVPEGEAVLTERRNLPAQYVAYVVRYGIGSMPQFTATDLTEDELARLAQWLDEKN